MLTIRTQRIKNTNLSAQYSGVNRIPILLLGPLLHRAGEASIPLLGGCSIGARSVNFHLEALKKLGASLEETGAGFLAKGSKFEGKIIQLPYPSVGATESVILSAVLASGRTIIINAAIEPEIIDTILLLQKMGSLIHIDADRKIIIEGVKKLNGATHFTIPDRVESASYAIGAVATNGRVEIKNARQEHMISLLNVLLKIGGGFNVLGDSIVFYRVEKKLNRVHVETDVFPGFATDWQPLVASILSISDGISVIHETVYEHRFGYVESLKNMGARITVTPDCLGAKVCRFAGQNHMHSCIIQGPSSLVGSNIKIPDLRAGFAYVIAALIASGQSEITDVHLLERGYSEAGNKLESLGADIKCS